ncbi:hypothetical protein IFM89_007579 [Coptis chinensis]|uniref:Uncharacterized protein n=1 Tax=Coptis chinensis TaxID=261450 RepID=A0A835GZQ4_9MAGN|nr:hypothetical protein IFM89_007579 [Coptis chinensis]
MVCISFAGIWSEVEGVILQDKVVDLAQCEVKDANPNASNGRLMLIDGTLAASSVADGFKVRVVSPDKDFFQILSPSLRLLRISSRESDMVSFGLENFA